MTHICSAAYTVLHKGTGVNNLDIIAAVGITVVFIALLQGYLLANEVQLVVTAGAEHNNTGGIDKDAVGIVRLGTYIDDAISIVGNVDGARTGHTLEHIAATGERL